MLDILSQHKNIIIIEEHNFISGLGDSIFNLNKNNENKNRFLHIALNDKFVMVAGSSKYLRKRLKIDSDSILEKIKEFIEY